MKLMPVQSSPDTLFLNALGTMTLSKNAGVSEGLSRTVSLVAYPPIALVSVIYNTLAFAIKAPVAFGRYTIGFIPTSHGKLADKFPKDSKASHMAWHAYKVLMFWTEALFCPLSVIRPKSNIFLHRKMGLITQEPSLPPRNPPVKVPLLPPRHQEEGESPPPPLPRDKNMSVENTAQNSDLMNELLNNSLFQNRRI